MTIQTFWTPPPPDMALCSESMQVASWFYTLKDLDKASEIKLDEITHIEYQTLFLFLNYFLALLFVVV